MYLRSAAARHFEPETDLNTFNGLNAHQSLRQTAVQFPIPLRVRAQPRRQS